MKRVSLEKIEEKTYSIRVPKVHLQKIELDSKDEFE